MAVEKIEAPRAGAEDARAGLVGTSASMRELFRWLERIRATSATVVVTGENGTGKELVARAIHEQSPRAAKRFVATNCGAFNDNLLESEFFGHKRGSFTGAVGDKPGLFDVADGGTFFMDEVGDMSPALQVKLLRVLQEGVFFPVGATEPRRVDVRILAATNRDLSAMVERGTFRQDLFYRLNVVALRVPPLRERVDDIPLLAQHFLAKLGSRDGYTKLLSATTLERLVAHRWPGNVRELENEIERLWVLSGDAAVISDEHLSPAIARTARRPGNEPRASVAPEPSFVSSGGASADDALPAMKLPAAIEALERRMIVDGLQRARGNKTRAAEALGISRRNLIRKVRSLGIEVSKGPGLAVDDDEAELDEDTDS
jgi:transcriptional regulator with GAF, ATPase, and Fis domain